MEDRDVTAAEAARIFGIPASTIHKWRERGKVTPCLVMRGAGRRGEQPLFRLSEVAGVVADRHAKKKRSATGCSDAVSE